MKDLANVITPKRVLSPVSTDADTALVGDIIDKKSFESVTYVIATGSIGDANATFTVLLEEGDAAAMGDATAVADADLLGTEALASFIFSDDNKCFKLGYIGSKRYTRLTITPSGNSGTPSAALLSAVAILGNPQIASSANPPA